MRPNDIRNIMNVYSSEVHSSNSVMHEKRRTHDAKVLSNNEKYNFLTKINLIYQNVNKKVYL